MSVNLNYEKRLWEKGYKNVVGVDESGRGPLAGPVVAVAVFVKKSARKNISSLRPELKDSKKLTPQKRRELYQKIIKNSSLEWRIAKVFPKVIDRINIKAASELAMQRAVEKIERRIDFLLIDGKFLKNKKLKNMNHRMIIKADEKVFSCVTAGILAKVERDKIMKRYHQKYPEYGFNKHKGYGTKLHKKMLRKHDCCSIHRKSFKLD